MDEPDPLATSLPRTPPPLPPPLPRPTAVPQNENLVRPDLVHAARRLRESVRDCRLLGGIFVTLGGLLMLMLLAAPIPGGRWYAKLMLASNSVMLVGPGVWYITAATFIKRLEPWAIRVSFFIAAGQFTVVAAAFLSLILPGVGGDRFIFVIPACLNLFFLPALAALVWQLFSARSAMNILMPAGRSFEVMPVMPQDRGE